MTLKKNMLRLYNNFLLKNHTQFRSVERAMKFLSCGVCVYFTKCAPNVAAATAIINVPIVVIVHRSPLPSPSLVGHHCHPTDRARAGFEVAVTHGSPSLVGHHHLWVAIACGSPLLVGHHCSRVTVARGSLSLMGRHCLWVTIACGSLL